MAARLAAHRRWFTDNDGSVKDGKFTSVEQASSTSLALPSPHEARVQFPSTGGDQEEEEDEDEDNEDEGNGNQPSNGDSNVSIRDARSLHMLT